MRASRLAIVPRNVELDFESVPVFAKLIDGGLLEPMTDLFSCAFPPGERFFIELVQHFNENIRTPLLREQVRLFFHQEAMHAKVHQDWNETLWQTLPVGRRVQGNAADFLDLARRRTTRRFQLALTCAIEHFTAMFADSALREQEAVCRRCHPAIAQMWLWHAAEETEHKAVCFDVYREVVGTGLWPYLVRISAIAMFTLVFFYGAFGGLWWIGRYGTVQPEPAGSDRRPSPSWFKQRKLSWLLWDMLPWRQYFAYYKPSFHPWDHDNSHLVEAWKQRFPAEEEKAAAGRLERQPGEVHTSDGAADQDRRLDRQ